MLAFAILLPLAAAAASAGTVYGQNCGLQVGSMAATTQNSGSYYGSSYPYNIQLTVPMTMSCNAGPQVWTTGTAYDTVTNTNLGTIYVTMSSNNGYYSGQLVFNLPSSVVEHQLQVQIQVYNGYNNGQYSGLVATSSPTVTIHASSLYNSNPNGYGNNYYNGYPGYSNSYYNGYPTGYYNGYYYYSYYPSYSYYNNGYSYYYPYYYYYSYSYPYYSYHYSSCYNGQTIIYYNGNYYYASCYSYYRHH